MENGGRQRAAKGEDSSCELRVSKPVVPDDIYKTLLKLTGSEDRERPLCANASGCSGS
jgi:hypothetical protein